MISVGRILCPTDFSPLSARGLEHALTLARWYDAEVVVLHVAGRPGPAVAGSAFVPSAELAPEPRATLRRELHAFVEPVRERGVPLRLELAEGPVAEEILRLARRLDGDLIVLGTHGRQGLRRWALGSVTEEVLKTAPCPVLTVSPGAQEAPSARFETVLCPVDFSPASGETARAAHALATEAQARLVLLHVVEGPAYPPIPLPAGIDKAAYRRDVAAHASGRLWALLPEAGGATEVAVAWGPAPREITRQARERGSGLIVMGAHGGARDSALFGSTTHRVVRRAPCPVMVLRARAHGFDQRSPEPVGVLGRVD